MAKSILQGHRECVLTGYDGIYLDKHHVFGGANRKKSEQLGLWVWVQPELHNLGRESIHRNAELDRTLKKWAQRICMERYDMSIEDFIREFGRNYILTEGDWEASPSLYLERETYSGVCI